MTRIAGSMAPQSTTTKRAKVACKVCNARRVRCNAVERQPCDNCQARGLLCVLVQSRRGKRPTSNGDRSHQVDPQSLSTDPADSSPTSQDSASLPDASPNNGDCRYSRSSGRKPVENTGSVQSPDNARADTISRSRSGTGAVQTIFLGEASSVGWAEIGTDQRRPTSGSDEGSLRLLFPAPADQPDDLSTSSLSRSTRKAMRTEHLRSIGAFQLPNGEVLEEMLRTYFKWFHPCFPILDRVSFGNSYAGKSASPLLLQAMLFIAATYCEPCQLQNWGFADLEEARSLYYNNAKNIYDANYEEDKMAIIQALFLMSYWREEPQNNTRHRLAAAISLAQEHGMHRARTRVTEQAEQSLRKRIWWTLYVRDRQASISVGMPWFIHDQDCDVEELTVGDFREHTRTEVLHFLEQQTNEHIQYPVQMAKLAKVIGDIVKTEFRLFNKHTSVSERVKLKDRLSQWERELPDEMKPQSGLGYDFNIFASMLNAFFYNGYILLYRSSYVRIREPRDEDEGHIALQAACKITSIAEDLLAQSMIRYVNTHMLTCLFNSLCIHTICLRRSNDIGRQVAEKRAQICLLGLQEMKKSGGVNNWILKLYFEHIENPFKKRLQAEDSASNLGQQQNHNSENFDVASSVITQTQSALPSDLPVYLRADPLSSVWSSAFFNSKEAENFSLYQLEPTLFDGETFDFDFDPYMNHAAPL